MDVQYEILTANGSLIAQFVLREDAVVAAKALADWLGIPLKIETIDTPVYVIPEEAAR